MKQLCVIGATFVSFVVAAGGATAADLATSVLPAAEFAPGPMSVYDWSGIYGGLAIGYGWAKSDVLVLGPDEEFGTERYDGVVGGGFAGYNWQAGNFVGGVEGDIMASGMDWKEHGASIENAWNATMRARAGVAIDRFMPYVTGGVAFGGIDVKIGGDSDTRTPVGWVVGGGTEVAIGKHVTARVEYRYTDYGTDTYTVSGSKIKVGFDLSQVLTGLAIKY